MSRRGSHSSSESWGQGRWQGDEKWEYMPEDSIDLDDEVQAADTL